MVYRTLPTLMAAATLLFLLTLDSQAACERISKASTGASKSIALTNAREALLGLQSSKFSGGTCKPMALRCKQEDNQWRCTARRDCCTAGTQFIDADIDQRGTRVCKTISGLGTDKTRKDAHAAAYQAWEDDAAIYAQKLGVPLKSLNCERRGPSCRKFGSDQIQCDVTAKCCTG